MHLCVFAASKTTVLFWGLPPLPGVLPGAYHDFPCGRQCLNCSLCVKDPGWFLSVKPTIIPGLGHNLLSLSGLPSPKWGFSSASVVKNPPAKQETWVQSLHWEDPLEKEMATDSSILAWRIPWTEEPGRLQSKWSQRVGHHWVTLSHTHKYMLAILFVSIT